MGDQRPEPKPRPRPEKPANRPDKIQEAKDFMANRPPRTLTPEQIAEKKKAGSG